MQAFSQMGIQVTCAQPLFKRKLFYFPYVALQIVYSSRPHGTVLEEHFSIYCLSPLQRLLGEGEVNWEWEGMSGLSSPSVPLTLHFFPLPSQGITKEASVDERDKQLLPMIARQETKNLFSRKYEIIGLVDTNGTILRGFLKVTQLGGECCQVKFSTHFQCCTYMHRRHLRSSFDMLFKRLFNCKTGNFLYYQRKK